MYDLKQSKVNLKTSKNIKKGHLYIVGAYLNRPLQFAVCLGFTDRNEPYFYLFGALQGYFPKNGNSIIAVLDTDYMKAMLVPIVQYEFSKTANQKSFLHSVNIHIYDINIGKIPIDIDNISNELFVSLKNSAKSIIDYIIDKDNDDSVREIVSILVDECLRNRGEIRGIDLTKDKDAIEIWLIIEDEAYCYYFFPYDAAIIEV